MGPQPYEGILSAVCEAFGCPPDVAARQDPALVRAVLDYRNAHTARDLYDAPDKARAFATLARNPELSLLLARMRRAQEGADLSLASEAEGMAVAAEYRDASEEGDE